MPYLQIDGLKVHYVKKGKGRETLLLVHGNVSSSEYWAKFMRLLPVRYQAIALDQRGCGKTEHPQDGYTIDQLVEDLKGFVDRSKLKRFHLLGHSMGGQVSMLYTLKYPERVKTLAILDSVPADGLFLNDEVRGYFEKITNDRHMLRQTMDMVMPYGRGPSFAGRATEIASACAIQAFTMYPESMHMTNILPMIKNIKIPTLIMHGKDDAIIPLEFMIPTMKAMVDARVVIFTRCGHSPQVERPKEFADKYLGFVEEHISKKRK